MSKFRKWAPLEFPDPNQLDDAYAYIRANIVYAMAHGLSAEAIMRAFLSSTTEDELSDFLADEAGFQKIAGSDEAEDQ